MEVETEFMASSLFGSNCDFLSRNDTSRSRSVQVRPNTIQDLIARFQAAVTAADINMSKLFLENTARVTAEAQFKRLM
jgi:hypothetical protein